MDAVDIIKMWTKEYRNHHKLNDDVEVNQGHLLGFIAQSTVDKLQEKKDSIIEEINKSLLHYMHLHSGSTNRINLRIEEFNKNKIDSNYLMNDVRNTNKRIIELSDAFYNDMKQILK